MTAGLGNQHNTITTGDKYIPEIWSERVQRAYKSKLGVANLVLRLDSDVKAFGDTIHVPKPGVFVANDKAASTQITPQANTDDYFTLTVDKHKEASFLIEDNLDKKSKYNLEGIFADEAGFAIAKKIDSDILALYSGLSQNVGGSGADLTKAYALSAIEKLDVADIPMEDRHWIFYPSIKTDILNIDNFSIESSQGLGGSNAINTGSVEKLLGIPIFWSTNVPITSTTFVHNMLIQKEAFALAMQMAPRTQRSYIHEYLGDLYTVDTLYGVAEYRDGAGVEVRTRK
jgi:hypothetical protein